MLIIISRPNSVKRTSTDFSKGIILVARLTVTAVAAREVVTDLAPSTVVRPHLTLINVWISKQKDKAPQ